MLKHGQKKAGTPTQITQCEPPGYARDDPIANEFVLHRHFVYLTTDDDRIGKPRYQIGRIAPNKLHLRPLRPGEGAKVLADAGVSAAAGDAPQTLPVIDMIAKFNQETTLYVIDLPLRLGEVPEIRGRHPRCLPGHVRLEKKRLRLPFGLGLGLGGGRRPLFKFYHVTRPANRDFLNPGNEQQLRRHGYDPSYELKEKLLFSVEADRQIMGAFTWKNGLGQAIASEVDGKMRLLGDEMALQLKEVLLACWVCVVELRTRA
ncbi:uncharacterized protein PG986_012938 [Apiospora aurea]|uniref:Uncharacterized protein n=1 Tax=Apiospora aurea TaxID=335848 RepID=A0ABR1Q1F4_9PEZI